MTVIHSVACALLCLTNELNDSVINLLNVLIGIRFPEAELSIRKSTTFPISCFINSCRILQTFFRPKMSMPDVNNNKPQKVGPCHSMGGFSLKA